MIPILNELISSTNDICFSGGAAGADLLFGTLASSLNHQQIHFSFEKAKVHVPEEFVLRLPNEVLYSDEVRNKLIKANSSLNRTVPYNGYVYNLLARNSFQVLYTERLYTIGNLASPSQLDGGTAWAVQMYLDIPDIDHEIYHFNINDKVLYSFDESLYEFVEVQSVPVPHGKWTGIGSRSATKEDLEQLVSRFYYDV